MGWCGAAAAVAGLHARSLDLHVACLHANSVEACSCVCCAAGRDEKSIHMRVGIPTAGRLGLHICISCSCVHMQCMHVRRTSVGTCLCPASLARHVEWSRVLALLLPSFSADPPFPPGISCLYCVWFPIPHSNGLNAAHIYESRWWQGHSPCLSSPATLGWLRT